MADKPIVGFTRDELTEMVRQILAEIPSSLPANGGNADYADNAGNADKLDGKHASDFKAYQEYAPVYEGDLLDIVEMGTYSCSVDYTPNLPNGVESWCYVTMIKCSTSGYKRYICTPFNLLNTNNNILYLASEAYKDSDGKLIWQRVNDGGNANTVGGKGVNEFLAANIINNYDANTLYNAGIYLIANGANIPYAWGSLIGMPYRKPYGNLSPDFMGQIFIPNGDSGFENKMYFRTSQVNTFNEWNEVYSSNSKPYITGNASVKADSSVCVSEHGFIPSAVLFWETKTTNNVYAAASFDSMSFTVNFLSDVDTDIKFIIFK